MSARTGRKHGSNVPASSTEMTEHAARRAAFERAWAWYGGAEPTDEERAKIDAQLEAGWRAARKRAPKNTLKKKAA